MQRSGQESVYTRLQLLEDAIAPLVRGKRSNKIFQYDDIFPYDDLSGSFSFLQESVRARTIDTSIAYSNECYKPFYAEPFFQIVHSQDTNHFKFERNLISQPRKDDLHLRRPIVHSLSRTNFKKTTDQRHQPDLPRSDFKSSSFSSQISKRLLKSKEKKVITVEANKKERGHVDEKRIFISPQKEVKKLIQKTSQHFKLSSSKLFSKEKFPDDLNTKNQHDFAEISQESSNILWPPSPFPTCSEKSSKSPPSSLPTRKFTISSLDLESREGNDTMTLVEGIERVPVPIKQTVEEISDSSRMQLMIKKEREMMEAAKARMVERMKLFENGSEEEGDDGASSVFERDSSDKDFIPNRPNCLPTPDRIYPDLKDDEDTEEIMQDSSQIHYDNRSENSSIRDFSILGRAILSSCKSREYASSTCVSSICS